MPSDTALIVAPFWGNPKHVGCYRVDRFVRWLVSKDVNIVLVRAGQADQVHHKSWGVEITIEDPLGLHGDFAPDGDYTKPTSKRRPNRLRRLIARWLLIPDRSVVWAHKVARHPWVLTHGEGAKIVLSSSPPESPHWASAILAKRLGADLIVDMRDGWLDEPLRSTLHRFHFRRWIEARLESYILRRAKCIFVTSEIWKEMLIGRLPFTRDKTKVLTNGYPPVSLCAERKEESTSDRVVLLHAGRFTASRSLQKVAYLLDPILHGIQRGGAIGDIVLLGDLTSEDRNALANLEPRFMACGWSLITKPRVPRKVMLRQLCEASGLLLLSTVPAVIPSKLFEYLPTGKPILAVTPKDSAVWRAVQDLSQVFLVDLDQPHAASSIVNKFVMACADVGHQYVVPSDFTEEKLSYRFLQEISTS